MVFLHSSGRGGGTSLNQAVAPLFKHSEHVRSGDAALRNTTFLSVERGRAVQMTNRAGFSVAAEQRTNSLKKEINPSPTKNNSSIKKMIQMIQNGSGISKSGLVWYKPCILFVRARFLPSYLTRQEGESLITSDIILLPCTSGHKNAVITTTVQMQSRVCCPRALLLLFVPRGLSKVLHVRHWSCKTNKSRAEPGPWLKKSTNPGQDVSTQASGPDRVLWEEGWISEVKDKEGQRCCFCRCGLGCGGGVRGAKVWTEGHRGSSSYSLFSSA